MGGHAKVIMGCWFSGEGMSGGGMLGDSVASCPFPEGFQNH